MIKRRLQRGERGSVLIACIIIALLVLATMVQFVNWVSQSTRANVHRLATQKAMVSADSGIQTALQFLRTPQAAQLHAGVPLVQTSVAQGTTFYVQYTRRTSDTSLVDVNATGYYQLTNGNSSTNGQTSQKASVYAVVQLHTVGDYFAASPASLEIGYGSNISSGMVYGRDLTFDTGSGGNTVVKAAGYFNSINPPDYANYVTFLDPGQPQQLPAEPVLPALDPGMRNNYINMAGSTILAPGTVLSGNVDPPGGVNPPLPSNLYGVYLSPGDVTLGAVGSSFTVTGSFLIYSQGDIYIANTVNSQLGGTAWPALMAEGNIYISSAAPDNLTVNATMVTNGEIKALGNPRGNGTLTVKGGMVAGQGISFGNVYTLSRNYSYQAPDPTLPLPFSTNMILYKVTSGKFNQ